MHTATLNTAQHRDLAMHMFNHVWNLLDQPERSRDNDLEMIHAAHASRYHWGVAGEARHLAIGEWQIARVYATLGRAEPARFHAAESLRLAQEHGLGPFLTACGHEALARAAAIAGDTESFDQHVAAAEDAAAGISDEEERQTWRADMDSLVRPASTTS